MFPRVDVSLVTTAGVWLEPCTTCTVNLKHLYFIVDEAQQIHQATRTESNVYILSHVTSTGTTVILRGILAHNPVKNKTQKNDHNMKVKKKSLQLHLDVHYGSGPTLASKQVSQQQTFADSSKVGSEGEKVSLQ